MVTKRRRICFWYESSRISATEIWTVRVYQLLNILLGNSSLPAICLVHSRRRCLGYNSTFYDLDRLLGGLEALVSCNVLRSRLSLSCFATCIGSGIFRFEIHEGCPSAPTIKQLLLLYLPLLKNLCWLAESVLIMMMDLQGDCGGRSRFLTTPIKRINTLLRKIKPRKLHFASPSRN